MRVFEDEVRVVLKVGLRSVGCGEVCGSENE